MQINGTVLIEEKRYVSYAIHDEINIVIDSDKIHFDGFAHHAYWGSNDCACQEGACCPE
jgi:hypothetical protein